MSVCAVKVAVIPAGKLIVLNATVSVKLDFVCKLNAYETELAPSQINFEFSKPVIQKSLAVTPEIINE